MKDNQNYQVTDATIFMMRSLPAQYEEFRFPPDQLCYQFVSPLFEKATGRQRGYIHGLARKLEIDEYTELPYYIKDIRWLNNMQAGEVIEILKEREEEETIPLF